MTVVLEEEPLHHRVGEAADVPEQLLRHGLHLLGQPRLPDVDLAPECISSD